MLDDGDYLVKPGKRVLVTDGLFAGTLGTIKRIKKSQCVVAQHEGLAALALAYVPVSCLRSLSEEEYQEYMG